MLLFIFRLHELRADILIRGAAPPNLQGSTMEKSDKKPQRRQNGRIAFIVCRDDIRAELERGATMIAVYDMFATRLGFGYVQFTRYVNANIRGKPPKPRGKRKAVAAEWGRSVCGESARIATCEVVFFLTGGCSAREGGGPSVRAEWG
jgi:hypothetical protein